MRRDTQHMISLKPLNNVLNTSLSPLRDEETKSQGGSLTCQGHSASKFRDQDLTPSGD